MPSTTSERVESGTDWARVKQIYESEGPIPFDPGDGPYDPNDEAATEAFFREATVTRGCRGKQKTPTKQLLAIRLSPAVLEHFKRQGKGWQTRIDQALLAFVEQQTTAEALTQSSAAPPKSR
jgi:uncharacterized protein (DUF4415 family)